MLTKVMSSSKYGFNANLSILSDNQVSSQTDEIVLLVKECHLSCLSGEKFHWIVLVGINVD